MSTLRAASAGRLAAPLLVALLASACGPPQPRPISTPEEDAAVEDPPPDSGGAGGRGGMGGTGGRTPDAAAGSGGSGGMGGGGSGGSGNGGMGGMGGRPPVDAAAGAGGPDAGPDVGPDLAPPPPDVPRTCVMGMPGMFMNTAMPNQSGMFTVTFEATPTAAPTNGIVALSNGAPTTFPGYAVIVRFLNTNGAPTIDAINGADYQAPATAIPYMANMPYRFRLVVNMTAHTYAAYVTPPNGNEQTIGTGLMFRTGQTTITGVNSWGVAMPASGTGSIRVCGFAVQ